MKKLLLTFVCLTIMVSCGTNNKFVEKTLKDVGNGIYRSQQISNYLYWEHCPLFFGYSEDDNPFSDIEIINTLIATPSNTYNDMYRQLTLDYFNTNFIFEDIKFIDKQKTTINVYSRWNMPILAENNISEEEEKSLEVNNIIRERAKSYDDYKEYVDFYTYRDYKEVPLYILKYKLDNKYLATIHLVDIPNKGLKITQLKIE